jgi:hypothetical protein
MDFYLLHCVTHRNDGSFPVDNWQQPADMNHSQLPVIDAGVPRGIRLATVLSK